MCRVASRAGLRDGGCTNQALILSALKLVFVLISFLRDAMRAPPATLVMCTMPALFYGCVQLRLV
jgi:hypothetical protein